MIHSMLGFLLLMGAGLHQPGKPPPIGPTRPEATQFVETSRYADVMSFMQTAAAANPEIHLTTYGYTFEGRALPLAVIGAPDATPESVRATGKTRVFLQANIHAGEVEGKEVCLMLLRDIAHGGHRDWLENMVLLIAPIYNADGNERVNVRNRGAQHGPVGGMGTRHNAQDHDLNRDAMKLESAEARSMARLCVQYDPHVAVDMHTTDGSDHGYYLTYEMPGNPNCSQGIQKILRDGLLPAVTKSVKAKHGWDLFYYGGPVNRPERAWAGDADLYKPRYTHVYWGMRNRLGILSEAYSYATFEDRIKANYWFVEEILDFVSKNGPAIRKATADADQESIIGTQQAVRGRLDKWPELVDMVLADTVEEPNPFVPDRPMRRRVNGSERTERVPHYGLIVPTETSLAPRAYVIPAPQQSDSRGSSGRGRAGDDGAARVFESVIDRLQAHGISYFKTAAPITVKADHFKIESSTQEAEEYRGAAPHKLRTITGAWEPFDATLPAGSLVVPMSQPLARLIFLLMDARSDDGLLTWNVFDPMLTAIPAPQFYPVLRTMEEIAKPAPVPTIPPAAKTP